MKYQNNFRNIKKVNNIINNEDINNIIFLNWFDLIKFITNKDFISI
jgi:hypothetical protein